MTKTELDTELENIKDTMRLPCVIGAYVDEIVALLLAKGIFSKKENDAMFERAQKNAEELLELQIRQFREKLQQEVINEVKE